MSTCKKGDKIRVVNKDLINGGQNFVNGGFYTVKTISDTGSIHVENATNRNLPYIMVGEFEAIEKVEEQSMSEYKKGDKIKIVRKRDIYRGDNFINGEVLVIDRIDSHGAIYLEDPKSRNLAHINPSEYKYIEKVEKQDTSINPCAEILNEFNTIIEIIEALHSGKKICGTDELWEDGDYVHMVDGKVVYGSGNKSVSTFQDPRQWKIYKKVVMVNVADIDYKHIASEIVRGMTEARLDKKQKDRLQHVAMMVMVNKIRYWSGK